jgi:hypothetical protein
MVILFFSFCYQIQRAPRVSGITFIMYAQAQHIWNQDDLKEIDKWVNIYLLSISIESNRYLVSPFVAHENYTSWMKGFSYYWYCHVCLTPLGIWYHHLLDMNTTHRVWYVSLSTGVFMSSHFFRYLVSPSVALEHYTLCMICFCTTGFVMSSLSVRYLVSPSVAQEHDTLFMIGFFYYSYCHVVSLRLVFGITLCCTRTQHYTVCMLGFVYYWYCHVVSLLYVFGITICCTRTWNIVYDRFLLLLVLSCRLPPLGIWYHHLLHTNMTHCVWYISFTTGIVISSPSFRYLVSPSVAHEHYTLCMIGFIYYWYCHFVSLL